MADNLDKLAAYSAVNERGNLTSSLSRWQR